MEGGKSEVKPIFSESYIRLCMTEEIKSEFGPPIFKGNYCIYKNDPIEIYRVVRYGGRLTEIDLGEGATSVKTSDLTWLPTVKEIQQEFYIQEDDGFWHDFRNFIRDPIDFGYSRADLRHFLSEEERWLLYCMVMLRRKRFNGKEWLPFECQ